jgi:hypothetical protein
MRDLVVLFIHFIATLARLLGPGGARSIVAESLLLKHQLLIVNRSRQRSPNLSASDRILAGLMALVVRPTRLLRSAIVLKPSTLLGLHKALSKQKYRLLFSTNRRRKPGPKGPSAELIRAVVQMKQRNPNWGCPRIAQQIALVFHIRIEKDVVRRILAAPQAKRSHDAEEANNVSRRPKANRCRATRSMGKGQSGKEDSQSLVRFPNKLTALPTQKSCTRWEGRELVCPAVWNKLGHVAILMHGLPVLIDLATFKLRGPAANPTVGSRSKKRCHRVSSASLISCTRDPSPEGHSGGCVL